MPEGEVDAACIKKLGFSAASSASLLEILKMLEFVDDNQRATAVWASYISSDDRARVLATAIKTAYPGLFKKMMCPYLAGDELILDYFKVHVDISPREMEYALETFRALCELADFQDLLDDFESVEPIRTVKIPEAENLTQVKMDPNLQMNIQIHIDPNTPDEKIETIFKYMRKYLLGE